MSTNQKVWAQAIVGWLVTAVISAVIASAVLGYKMEAAQGEIRELRQWRQAHESEVTEIRITLERRLATIETKQDEILRLLKARP